MVDLRAGRVIGAVPVGSNPTSTAVSPDGSLVYVTNYESHDVSVIDARVNEVVARLDVGRQPSGVAFGGRGDRVYVTNTGDDDSAVTIIDPRDHTVVLRVPVERGPYGVSVGDLLFVTQYYSDSIVALDPLDGRVVLRTPVGQRPESVAISPDTGRVYVSNRHSHEVSVIDMVCGAVVATIAVRNPGGIAVGTRAVRRSDPFLVRAHRRAI
ncbi:hypothetical protein GCM10027598_74990 [Amycolatopsis oliviviridis]|uniref:Uncharacterized protein n=1 Tax=Amycolatopsis oliviviridis TaxID=1471590 RepID=A0ABQ3L447_9PSEU|nr:YncE family protein [Amycolatopsis oliviviridis]GHH03226.1 hypothetical protein GCM10017790_04930 [Amycolatopsis oliviviridis]